jgi:hypothetical protein
VSCAAKILRASVLEAQSKGKLATLKVYFLHFFQPKDTVNVSIWHDAADDCGSLCDLNVRFLKQVAEIEKSELTRKEPMAIYVRPRFIFQRCDPDSDKKGRCAKTCTVNGKCAFRVSPAVL